MKTLSAYVSEQYNKRSTKDKRKKIDWYLVEYKGKNGNHYRKSFEFPMGTKYQDVIDNIPKEIE